MVGIYKITNPSNKVYIGQSLRIEVRLNQYKSANCRNQRHLHSSILKHGWENHSFQVIHTLPDDVDQEVLNAYEIYYWQQYKISGFKMMNIREPGSKGKISEETKQKWKGRIPHNKGKTGSLDPKWGKKWPAERVERRLQTRMVNGASEKAAQKMKGRIKSKEHQEKISNAKKKPILHVQTNVVYKSRKEAAIAFGFKDSTNLRIYIKKGLFKYI
jgi:group I intron endonuclease